MPHIFDTASLVSHFSEERSQSQLRAFARNLSSGLNTQFTPLLLDDEVIRERSKTYKEGIDFDRERLTGLTAKVQQLQARLQAVYQALLDRTLTANSAEVATDQSRPDIWTDGTWRIAGADVPLNYARAAHTRPDLPDTFGDGPDNLGRLHFWRPMGNGSAYEERAGFFTTMAYLYEWDLHQVSATYATGTDPGLPAAINDISQENTVQVVAVDPAKHPGRQWKAGDVILLSPGEIFTPEFLGSAIGQHTAGISYINGSGYQFDTNVSLYAYVREVDLLPDGLTRPRSIDILSGPAAVDANGDGEADNVVWMDDYLRSITTLQEDFTLRDDVAFSQTAVNGWIPDTPNAYHFQDAPPPGPNGGVGFDHSVWAGANWQGSGWGGGLGSGQWDDARAAFRRDLTLANDPLQHPTLNYTLPWNVRIDDYGALTFWNGTAWQSMATDTTGGPAGGVTSLPAIASMDLHQNVTHQFEISGYNRLANRVFLGTSYEKPDGSWTDGTGVLPSWRDGPGGLQIDNGKWDIQTLRPETAPGENDGDQNIVGTSRYYVDKQGNIFDLFGDGNSRTDYYDYIPDVMTNRTQQYVGNVFGQTQRLAVKRKLDANGNNTIDAAEAAPSLQFSPRDYNKPDDVIVLPGQGATGVYDAAMGDPGGSGSAGTVSMATYNPQFAETYMGFVEDPTLQLGRAGVQRDAFGNVDNRLVIWPQRTGDSLSTSDWTTTGDAQLDRDYVPLPAGTTVLIRDGFGAIVDGQATLSAQNPDGSYLVTPSSGVKLRKGQAYSVLSTSDPDARAGGSLTNGLSHILMDVLTGSEYRAALRAGLLEDLMVSASATDAFGGSLSAKMTFRYNKRQERVEIYQNSFAAFYKSGK
ncbi:MAG: hypothetical protein H7338_22700 [Candidatus Sericytochromatia bacterium]|nr:hypothetical protein [Candidatus Sericytochromatia bacterium]